MGFTLNQLEQERQIRKLQKKEDKDTKDYEQLSNLPKVNNVELKGNKTTSDLGINADNVMLSDGMTSVEDAVKNVFPVGKNSITLPYTAQKDGILVVRAHPSTTAGGIYGVYVTMSNSEVDAFIVTCATGNDNTASFPVAKGTILTEYGAISTITAYISYYPMF